MSYYDELVKSIQKLISSKDYAEAKRLINNELNMPYIPRDTEERLKDFLAMCPNEQANSSISDETIIEYLKGTPEKQLMAVNVLNGKNLRDYLDICNEYLTGDGFINAKVLLVESLVRQEISDEIKLNKDGFEYSFIPRYVMMPEESEGFRVAYDKLKDIFMKNPSMFEMSKSLLYKECLMALPVSYIEEEGDDLADKISKYVLDAFN